MNDKHVPPEMDSGTRRFISKIVNTAMFNIFAFDNQLFDTLICESNDPEVMQRWQEAEPLIMDAIQRRIDTDPEDQNWLGL